MIRDRRFGIALCCSFLPNSVSTTAMSKVIIGNWTRTTHATYTAPASLIIGLALGVVGAFTLILLAIAIAGRMICIARKYDQRNKELVIQLANRGISADEALREAKLRADSARQVRARGAGAALLLQTAGDSGLPVAQRSVHLRPTPAGVSQLPRAVVVTAPPPRAAFSIANLPRAIVQADGDDTSSDGADDGADAAGAPAAVSEASRAAVRVEGGAAADAPEERRAD